MEFNSYSLSISPQKRIPLQITNPPVFASWIDCPLEANILVFTENEKVQWLLISLDLIGLEKVFSLEITCTLEKQFNIDSKKISISCSHTHSGPATMDMWVHENYPVIEKDEEYLDFLKTALVNGVKEALKTENKLHMKFGRSICMENVSRRKIVNGKCEFYIAPENDIDNTVKVWSLLEKNEIKALIVSYSCHPTITNGLGFISSDWPGHMREKLRKRFGNIPVLFLQGCAGDLTHRIARDEDTWPAEYGQKRLEQASLMAEIVLKSVLEAIESSSEISIDSIATVYSKVIFNEKTESLPIQSVILQSTNSNMLINFIAGEPFSSFDKTISSAIELEGKFQKENIVTCGYTNGNLGYIPDSHSHKYGGYEIEVAYRHYRQEECYPAEAESLIINKLKDMVG